MIAENPRRRPRLFISYSWGDEEQEQWTRDFAARLRADGVDVTLDKWTTVPGDQLTLFMENAIRENDYVLIICSPDYKAKCEGRSGCVVYEKDIMTGDVLFQGNHRKFIPVLRRGEPATSIPSWLCGKYFVDLRGDPYSEKKYEDLLSTLHHQRESAPPLGLSPWQPADRQEAQGTLSSQVDRKEKCEFASKAAITSNPMGEPSRVHGNRQRQANRALSFTRGLCYLLVSFPVFLGTDHVNLERLCPQPESQDHQSVRKLGLAAVGGSLAKQPERTVLRRTGGADTEQDRRFLNDQVRDDPIVQLWMSSVVFRRPTGLLGKDYVPEPDNPTDPVHFALSKYK